MSSYKTSGKQLAKNTIYLYLRQLLTLLISFYTVRVTMSTLGIEDYGINSVVAGTVSMFSFLSGAMATGTQRFFSYYIGSGETEKLKQVFKLSFTVYLLLIALIVLLQEVIGLWFISHKLVIPPNRFFAANFIYQLSIVGSVFSIIVAPFMASVIAHENMSLFARVGIAESILKLLVVFILMKSPYDKLISYGFLYLLVGILVALFYQQYTKRHYEECRIGIFWNGKLAKEVLSFNGWNLFGSFAWVMKNQGLAMLLNMFYGPIVNASQQIGNQVRTISTGFAQNFSTATTPQIIKSYAAKEYDRLFSLAFRTAKLNYILMFMITLPVLFHIDFVLDIWLEDVPLYAGVICKLLLLETLTETSSLPFATINQATGRIGLYQFLIGFVGLLNIPIAYLSCRLGALPEIAFVIGVMLQIIIAAIRILFVQRVRTGIIGNILIKVYSPCILMSLVAYIISYFVCVSSQSIYVVIFEIAVQVIIVLIFSYFIVLDREERKYLVELIQKKINK